MTLKEALEQLFKRQDLSFEQMQSVMQGIMTGEATPAQIAGFLVALRMKGETVDEISAAASVMRSLASKVEIEGEHIVDTCGTGGDGANTFNISTASAFVVAAAGGKVAKHGNRSVSSSCGSADILEALGVNVSLNAEQVKKCVDTLGVGFMFAPMHHSAMKHAIGPRKELAVRTIFNLLGPLTNPAGAPSQVMGVFDAVWIEPLAQVLNNLGSKHVLVVHGTDGLDEISISAPTVVAELKAGKVSQYQISPEDFGMKTTPIEKIKADTVEESLAHFHSVINNEEGPARDIVALNSGAAIYAADLAGSLANGIEMALDVIALGGAKEKMNNLAALTTALKEEEA